MACSGSGGDPFGNDNNVEYKWGGSRILTRRQAKLLDTDVIMAPIRKPRRRARSKRIQSSKSDKDSKVMLDTNTFEICLEKLWSRSSEDKRSECTYFDSLWFSMYIDGSEREKVLRWIKHKHIFSKKYVFVPILCWRHWSLLILCHFGETVNPGTKLPCMLLLDSLQSAGPTRLEANLRRFIRDIYSSEGREESEYYIRSIPLLIPKVPQQKNGEGCGIYVLYFIHAIMEMDLQEHHPFLNESRLTPDKFETFLRDVYPYLRSTSSEDTELAKH